MLQQAATPSRRAAGVEYAIRDVVVKAEEVRRSGKKILNLNIGDPVPYGFDTPQNIKEAMKRAIDNGSDYYSASEGIKQLREAVAQKENTINHAQIGPDDVLITQGISEAIMFLMASIVNPGDEVLLPGPCYPPYITFTKFFDGKPVTYQGIEEKGWAPDLLDLERKITERTRLIVVINPSNPTGSVYSKQDLARVIELAASRNIPIAADEIYDRIVYDGNFTSVASLAKDTPIFGLNGFSKAHMMTGWRLGYLYVQDPEERLKHVWDGIQRMSRVRLCASTPTQMAGIEALTGPQGHITNMVEKLKLRRDYAWKRANAIQRLSAAKPAGAFYLFPRVNLQGTKWKTDEEFVTELLRETGVLVVHGSGFDREYGKDHFRAVFLPDEAMLAEAFDAVEGFIKRHT
ncbi:MAG TPA: aminotransferase class I/II-fold pyridoxal phosphate-dependent enzyme [Candidatus Acidoferrales bacterium]|nr:aminotransferase class I/II-fold pyridoxal phosphate-dependent enzyme [Candidatus Acidoferrales bacterium]